MTKLSMIRDINGYPIYQLGFPTIKKSVTLAQDTEATFTVPGNSASTGWVAVMRYQPGATVWFALNATADTPTPTTFADTTSCLNYPGTKVQTGDVLHFITDETSADVGVELYEL